MSFFTEAIAGIVLYSGNDVASKYGVPTAR